jgi:hypothetical protein
MPLVVIESDRMPGIAAIRLTSSIQVVVIGQADAQVMDAASAAVERHGFIEHNKTKYVLLYQDLIL